MRYLIFTINKIFWSQVYRVKQKEWTPDQYVIWYLFLSVFPAICIILEIPRYYHLTPNNLLFLTCSLKIFKNCMGKQSKRGIIYQLGVCSFYCTLCCGPLGMENEPLANLPSRKLAYLLLEYRAGISGGSSGSMEPLDFWERHNGTTRFLRFGTMEPVNF